MFNLNKKLFETIENFANEILNSWEAPSLDSGIKSSYQDLVETKMQQIINLCKIGIDESK